jgi:hypothetical protein
MRDRWYAPRTRRSSAKPGTTSARRGGAVTRADEAAQEEENVLVSVRCLDAPVTSADRARENREYVRQLLWRKQPEFAARLELAEWELSHCWRADGDDARPASPYAGA